MNEIAEIIYNHLSSQENSREITIEKTEEVFIENDKLNDCKKDTIERLKIKLRNGQCSQLLLEQLSLHRCNYGENFGNKIEFYDTSQILNLIELIELNKASGTKFTGDILKEYLHIHHSPYSSIGYSIVRNVKEYWYNRNQKIRKEKIEDFKQIIIEYANETIFTIAIKMHQIAISNKKLKGEWLIYKKHNEKNYYLCLASHREGINRTESDKNIFDHKISKCLIEFPELK
jgi:hypothetical protein